MQEAERNPEDPHHLAASSQTSFQRLGNVSTMAFKMVHTHLNTTGKDTTYSYPISPEAMNK